MQLHDSLACVHFGQEPTLDRRGGKKKRSDMRTRLRRRAKGEMGCRFGDWSRWIWYVRFFGRGLVDGEGRGEMKRMERYVRARADGLE